MAFGSRGLAALALSLSSTLIAVGPVSAQAVYDQDNPLEYDRVRGWTVYAIDWRDGVHGCRGLSEHSHGQIMLERIDGIWSLIVPSRQGARFSGGVVWVDGYAEDSQFAFFNGYAAKELSWQTLDRIRNGNRITVRINGDPEISSTLSGSAAAILKIEECADYGGENPRYGQAQTLEPAAPAPPPPGGTIQATCGGVAMPDYGCVIRRLAPEPGYMEVLQVDPDYSDSAPSWFVKVLSDTQSDMWVSFGGEPWVYLGLWESNGNCAYPAAAQSAEARRNLGQDAWELCVYE